MATIILLASTTRIYNAASGDLMEAHNTSVTNLNNELITKLPLAGGTMTGDVNMDSHYITNLPAPVNNADAARKQDTVPAAGSIVTSMIADLNVTLAKLAADSVDSSKISHDNNRTKAIFSCAVLTTAGTDYAECHGAALSASVGIPMPRAGSLTKLTVSDNGTVYESHAVYGTHAFAAHQQLTVYWGDGGTGVVVKIVGGANLLVQTGVTGTTPNIIVVLEVEFDD